MLCYVRWDWSGQVDVAAKSVSEQRLVRRTQRASGRRYTSLAPLSQFCSMSLHALPLQRSRPRRTLFHRSMLRRPRAPSLLLLLHHCCYDVIALCIVRFYAAFKYRLHTHPFNGPSSETTQVSRYQKGKTNLDFTEARDSEWQWHQLGRMQVCTLLQTDNHTSTPPLSFLQAGCPSCRQTNSVKALKAKSTEGK